MTRRLGAVEEEVMSKLAYTLTIDEESEGYYHIPNALPIFGGQPLTLCGWVDVAHKEYWGDEILPNCFQCLRILRYCKNMEIKITRLTGEERDKPLSPMHSAHMAILRAVKQGMKPATAFICADCGKEQAEEYHHHKGYDKEHWLDVIPLCLPCHVKTKTRRAARIG